MTYDRANTGSDAQADFETEQIAHELERAVRSLNRAVGEPGGFTRLATVHAVLDAVSAAASGLDQPLQQLERFLVRQHADGRLVHDHGANLDEALGAFSRAILHARHLGAGCGEAFNQARSAIDHVRGTGLPLAAGAPSSRNIAGETAPTASGGGRRARWFNGLRKGV
jgi:exonuclease VII small subunit